MASGRVVYVVKVLAESQFFALSVGIHKRCRGVKGSLGSCKNFKCWKMTRCSVKMSDSKAKSATVGLESVDVTIGDMLSAGGGVEKAVHCRVRYAWGKFNELMPIIKMRGTSLRAKGKIYKACVQSMMMYGSETWAMKVDG